MKYLRTLLKLYPEHLVFNSIIVNFISRVSNTCHEMSKQYFFFFAIDLRHIFKFHINSRFLCSNTSSNPPGGFHP